MEVKAWSYKQDSLAAGLAFLMRSSAQGPLLSAMQADEHARDNVSDAELALDKDGKFLGLRVTTLANVGAYISSERNLLATFGNVGTLTGTYDALENACIAFCCVVCNLGW